MLPFWLSIGVLSLTQGAVVALPGALSIPWLERRRGRLWAAIPPLSVIAFVFVARAAERASARSLTWLALAAVPILAALALGRLGRGARPALALLTPALFALAWADRAALPGEGAALALSALSCVALGVLLAAVTPPRWLAAGIVLMACADTALVVSELLRHPNEALNAAHPAAGLPRLQAAIFGKAAMGYGDLFVAGLFGGLLARGWPAGGPAERPPRLVGAPDVGAPEVGAREVGASEVGAPEVGAPDVGAPEGGAPGVGAPQVGAPQAGAALLVAVLAVAFDLLFFAVDELPATVPVALALIVVALAPVRAPTRGRRPRAHPPSRLRPPARMRPK